MRADIVPGGVFPDYELPDHTTKRRKLSELQGEDPTVLVLSRGGFCPKERRQHEGLVALHRELEVGYCRLVTISTDTIAETNEYRNGVGAHWPFLSDAGRKIQKDLDIAEYTDPLHNPMIPHTIVLEPGLVIYKIYMGYWFFGRPTMEELRQDLRAVLKKCRPDWDITTPEFKAAWTEGRKELFYPYGKTYGQTFADQEMAAQTVEMVASHSPRAGDMDAYERVLGAAMEGDATLFAREDYVEEAWRIVDPVLQIKTPVYEYGPKTWGPREAQRVVPPGGWSNPAVNGETVAVAA